MHSVLHAFTHSVLWASVIAAAFVAAVITLLIEYFAKPSLEVRKERILDESRRQRDALANFTRAANLANRLVPYKGQPAQMVSLMEDHIKRSAIDLQEYMLTAGEFMHVPKSVRREWEYTLSSMNALATVLPGSLQYLVDDFWEKFEAAFTQIRLFHKLFKTSRWHPWRRRKLIKEIAASPPPSTFKSAKERDSSC
jgi:hypothetical protein